LSDDKGFAGNVPLRLGEYIRVLKLTKKPTREEFSIIAKVAGAGILLIGLIGFIIYILITVMPGWFK
jgi:protein transport protein SEC61 subunit gamma-like protein